MGKLLFILAVLFLNSHTIFSQWSSNPEVNLQVCDVAGEQVLPKIANTRDGGTFICWFDNRSGSYAVYLQKLNSQGVKQFAPDGLLISGNPQSSSLVDWDMISDDSNNAIITFTDTRNGGSINPFAYKISSQGVFLWGANGIPLYTDAIVYQPNPKVVKTSDNNFVFTWVFGSTPNRIAFQKLSSTGVKLWGADPIYLAGAGSEHFTYPSLAPSDDGTVIALWSGYSGTFINPVNYKLYSQKFSSQGSAVWKDTVYNLGRVTGFFVPKIFSDGLNGAIYVWQDDRNSVNLQSTYIQRFSASGFKNFPVNGIEASTMPGMNKFDAWAASNPGSGFIYVVWKQTNSTQNSYEIYGQAISPFSIRTWTDNGKNFATLGSNSSINQICMVKDTNIIFAYNEAIFGSNNNVQKAFITNENGNVGWGGSPINVGSITGPKSKISGAIDANGMTKITWADGRTDANGIYAQNINLNGTLGITTGINILSNEIPTSYSLAQNFPNPFNPVTKISYQLKNTGNVSIKVFDILGNEIVSLVNEKQSAGSYEVTFDASSQSSGVYFYTLNTGDFSQTKSMLLVK